MSTVTLPTTCASPTRGQRPASGAICGSRTFLTAIVSEMRGMHICLVVILSRVLSYCSYQRLQRLLQAKGLGQYTFVFEERKIGYEQLLRMDVADLRELVRISFCGKCTKWSCLFTCLGHVQRT